MKTNLYKVNSINTHDQEFVKNKILVGIEHSLRDYINYIEKSIKIVQKYGAIKIPLRKIVEEKTILNTDDKAQEKSAEKKIRYYVDYEKVSEKVAGIIENELFERGVNFVFTEKPKGNYNKDKQFKVKIIDRNADEKYIIIDEKDEVEYIFLKANDYQLRKQKEAVLTLMNKPLQAYTPIQKLFDLWEKSEKYFEENIEKRSEYIDWAILKNTEEVNGTIEQQNFVKKALTTKDFALLEGPPGSGKTTAIIELIIQLIRENKRVLLVSATHVAVDNVIHRILTTYKEQCENLVVPLRIADNDGIIRKESVVPYRFQSFTKNIKLQIRAKNKKRKKTRSIELLDESLKGKNEFDEIILKSANLVGGTMIGILQHPNIKKGDIKEMFDVMIVDEASKVTFLDFLVPALYAKKWILVGDVNQLSPYTEDDFININIDSVINDESIKKKLIESFEIKRKLYSDKESIKVFFTEHEYKNVFKDIGYEVFYLNETFNRKQDFFKLNGADIIICKPTKENKKTLADNLFVKAQFFEAKVDINSFLHRQNAFFKVKRKKNKINILPFEFSSDKAGDWSEMVGSRLSQMYQYRFDPDSNEQIKRELDYLVPEEYRNNIEKIRRIALPSILELLQIGVGEKQRSTKDGKTIPIKTFIYKGFDQCKSIKEKKFQTLKYQHRMNDEIASISRDYFYEGKNLITANTVEDRKNKLSFYKEGEPNVIWVSNKDNSFRKRNKGGKQRNYNPTEVNNIKTELESFVSQAQSRDDNYEIAVLTFYRDQEFELRNMLRKLTGEKNKMKFFHKGNVKITLCTVDKFQGDEADLVLLSFAKFTKKAFYNSPNRLNVALTRARYKLVLFGYKEWLAKNAQLEALRELANNNEKRLTYKNKKNEIN